MDEQDYGYSVDDTQSINKKYSEEDIEEIGEKRFKKKEKRKSKKLKDKSESARFDCTFFRRIFTLFFVHYRVFSLVQIFFVVLVIVSSIGGSLLGVGISELSSDMYFNFTQGNHSVIWENISLMLMFNVLQGIAFVFTQLSTSMLSYFWRKNVTFALLKRYFKNNNYYEILHLKENSIDNPDQRIQSDTSDLASDSSEVFVGVLQATINIITNTVYVIQKRCYYLLIPIFIFPVLDFVFYMIIFSPVAKQVYRKDKYEGFFRYKHAMIREHSESIAFFYPKSESNEKRKCGRSYSALLRAWTCLVLWSVPLYIWSLAHRLLPYASYLLTLLILVFNDIYPFQASMETGQRMKIVSLFYQLAMSCGDSISDLFDLSQSVSNIIGNTARVGQMFDAYEEIDKQSNEKDRIRKSEERKEGYILDCFQEDDDEPEIRLEGVDIVTPEGKELIKNIDFQMRPGRSTIIMGPSGVGKSSILRVIAGLWNFDVGVIRRPREGIFFLPQSPYLIQSSLKANIVYPYDVERVNCTDEQLKECIQAAEIGYLLERSSLHQKFVKWDKELSLGEMQRVAIARCLFHLPIFALLDECSSALDEITQEKCYQALLKAGITCLSVAHRDTVQKYHEQIMRIDMEGNYMIEDIDRSKILDYDVNWKTLKKKVLQEDEKYQSILKDLSTKELKESEEKKKKRKKISDYDEIDDTTTGNSGLNWFFVKRLFRLCCCGIMIKKCVFWFYVVFAFIFNMICSGATLPLFLLASKVLGAICQKDTFYGYLFVSLYFVIFAFMSTLWGFNTLVWDFFEMRLRTNVTKHYHERYFRNRNSYKINVLDTKVDNIDQRICHDTSKMTHNVRNLLNVMTEAGFMTLLILAAGVYRSGPTILIFVFIIAFVSGLAQIIFMIWISKKRFTMMKREGYFRTSLCRMKEYSEQIAFYGGKDVESTIIEEKFRRLMKVNLDYELITTVNKSISNLVAKLSATISYMVIEIAITWGFVNFEGKTAQEVVEGVQNIHYFFAMAMKFFKQLLDEGVEVGMFAGNTARVFQGMEKLEELDSKWVVNDDRRVITDDYIEVENLDVETPTTQKKLIQGLNFRLDQNEHLLIQGPSGCGKSSLLRVIAGLWNSSEDSVISCPQNAEDDYDIYFLPQKPYVLFSTLIENIIYPEQETNREPEIEEILEDVNLGYLKDRKYVEDSDNLRGYGYLGIRRVWSTILSPGEQQRLGFARVLYHKVKFCFMDESTSSLDIKNENLVYNLCLKNNVTLFSIGHRSSIISFHNRLLEIDSDGGWRFAEVVNVEDELDEI